MKHQAPRILAVMLTFLLATPIQLRAGDIRFADVTQAVVDTQAGRPRVDLRLRHVSQSGQSATSGTTQQQGTSGGSSASSGTTQNGTQTTSGPATAPGAPLTGVEPAQGGGGQVETVDLGDVTGTVCDCGDFVEEVPGRRFPLWPLLGLGGIPLLFLRKSNEPPGGSTPTPTPTDTPPAIPEPTTIILLGSGLLALGARARRRGQKNADKGIVISEEG